MGGADSAFIREDSHRSGTNGLNIAKELRQWRREMRMFVLRTHDLHGHLWCRLVPARDFDIEELFGVGWGDRRGLRARRLSRNFRRGGMSDLLMREHLGCRRSWRLQLLFPLVLLQPDYQRGFVARPARSRRVSCVGHHADASEVIHTARVRGALPPSSARRDFHFPSCG